MVSFKSKICKGFQGILLKRMDSKSTLNEILNIGGGGVGSRKRKKRRKSSVWIFHRILSAETPVQTDIYSPADIVAFPLPSFCETAKKETKSSGLSGSQRPWKFSLYYSVKACKHAGNTLLMFFSKDVLVLSAEVTNISFQFLHR